MDIIPVKQWLKTRSMGRAPSTIVVHASAGASALSSVSWLRKINFSYHFIIERDGTVYKLVPVGPPCRVAFHAGVSTGPEGRRVNDYSLGICFANMQDGEGYTEAQEVSLLALCKLLKQAYPTLTWLTTHRLVSVGRKADPIGWKYLVPLATSLGLKPWRAKTSHDWIGGLIR